MTAARALLRGARAMALLAAFLAIAVGRGRAQATLVVTALDVELPAPEVADYAARASRPAAVPFAVSGCEGPVGCTLSIWAPGGAQDLEWQLDGTAPDRWRPVGALPQGGEVLRGVRGARRGVIYLRARLDWERDATAHALDAVRLSLAVN